MIAVGAACRICGSRPFFMKRSGSHPVAADSGSLKKWPDRPESVEPEGLVPVARQRRRPGGRQEEERCGFSSAFWHLW